MLDALQWILQALGTMAPLLDMTTQMSLLDWPRQSVLVCEEPVDHDIHVR